MPSVYAIAGSGSLRLGEAGCRRVRHGRSRNCTIEVCRRGKKLRFTKGSVRCGR